MRRANLPRRLLLMEAAGKAPVEQKEVLIDKYDQAMGEEPDGLKGDEKVNKFLKDATE